MLIEERPGSEPPGLVSFYRVKKYARTGDAAMIASDTKSP
jgi:hypothetical protein